MNHGLSDITPISSSDKIEQVLAALHRLIIDGNLKPGTELPAERHLQILESTITAMADNRDDLSMCAEQDILFHSTLVSAGGNFVFEIMLGSVSELLHKARTATLEFKGVDIAINAHKKILNAVRRQKPKEAERAMTEHLTLTKEAVIHLERAD